MTYERRIFDLGMEFLLNMASEADLSRDKVLGYLKVSKVSDMKGLYRRLCISAANGNRMTNTIKFEERESLYADALFNFDCYKVVSQYSSADEVFNRFSDLFDIKNGASSRNLLRRYARSVYTGAQFLFYFESIGDFHTFVDGFKNHVYSYVSLPLVIAQEVDGMGVALAADFLKESGYAQYGKPDVHIAKIFFELGLAKSTHPYVILRQFYKFCDVSGTQGYEVDKVFWLISTANFYNHKEIKMKGRREEFIRFCKERETRSLN